MDLPPFFSSLGVTTRMCGCRLMRYDSSPLPIAILAAVVVMLCSASVASAGILMPQQVGFDEKDLDQALSAGAAGASSHREHSRQWPPTDNDRESNPLDLLNSSLPTSSSSSGTSTSSAGGAVGSGVVLCVLNNAITTRDDSPLGQVAEDHGLSLPDPPGTDLLRPPRV